MTSWGLTPTCTLHVLMIWFLSPNGVNLIFGDILFLIIMVALSVTFVENVPNCPMTALTPSATQYNTLFLLWKVDTTKDKTNIKNKSCNSNLVISIDFRVPLYYIFHRKIKLLYRVVSGWLGWRVALYVLIIIWLHISILEEAQPSELYKYKNTSDH